MMFSGCSTNGEQLASLVSSLNNLTATPSSKEILAPSISHDFWHLMDIHPGIQKVSQNLYKDKHYSQAIEEAFKYVDELVAKKSTLNLSGVNLMNNAFGKNAPVLDVKTYAGNSGQDQQSGTMSLFAGSIALFRNPRAHKSGLENTIEECNDSLVLASLLCKIVDNSKKTRTKKRA
jgi:uncharacterized protein (TIGR02391 family)